MGTHALVLRRSMLQTIIDNGKMAIETSTQRYGIPPHQRATHRAVSDDSPVNMPLPIDEIWLYDRSLRSLVSHVCRETTVNRKEVRIVCVWRVPRPGTCSPITPRSTVECALKTQEQTDKIL